MRPKFVLTYLANERRRAKAIIEGISAALGVRNASDSQHMKCAKARLESFGIAIPKAFGVLLFREKACDLIRVRHLEECVEH